MLFLTLLLSLCAANITFYTTKDFSFTNGDMTCRNEDGTYLFRVNTRSFTFGHEFQVSAEPSGLTLVRAKRDIKWNPKTWLMRQYNLEFLAGNSWLPAVFKAKWLVDFRNYRTFDIIVGGETFTAKGQFWKWKFEITSNSDNKRVASVGLAGQKFFRWNAPNAQVYKAVVDETRINPALVTALLAILERNADARSNFNAGLFAGAATGAAVGATAIAVRK